MSDLKIMIKAKEQSNILSQCCDLTGLINAKDPAC